MTGTAAPAIAAPTSSATRLGHREGYWRVSADQEMSTAVIRLVPGATAGARQRIFAATRLHAGGPGDPPTAVVNLRRVKGIPFAVAALVVLFATLSLGHQLLVGVGRRRKDLAVLQALGVTRHGITRIIHVQATVLTAAVLLFAVPLGITAGLAIYRPFVDRVGAGTDLAVPGAGCWRWPCRCSSSRTDRGRARSPRSSLLAQ